MLDAQLGLEVFEGTCPASISKSSRKDWKPFHWYCLFLHLRPGVPQLRCLFFLFFDSCLDMFTSSLKHPAKPWKQVWFISQQCSSELRGNIRNVIHASFIIFNPTKRTGNQGRRASCKGGATLNVGWLRVWWACTWRQDGIPWSWDILRYPVHYDILWLSVELCQMVKLCGLQLDLSSVSRSIPTAFHPWHSAVTLAPSPLSTMMAWTCLTHHDCIQASVCPSELLLQCAPLPAGTQHHMNMARGHESSEGAFGKRMLPHRPQKLSTHINAHNHKACVKRTGKLHPRSQVIYEVRSNLLSERTFAKEVSNASFCCFSFIPHGFRSRFLWATCRFDVLHGFVQFWDVHDSSETTYELMKQQFKGTHFNFI